MEHLSGELLLLLALLRKGEHADLSASLCFCNNIFILISWNGNISWHTWVTFHPTSGKCTVAFMVCIVQYLVHEGES